VTASVSLDADSHARTLGSDAAARSSASVFVQVHGEVASARRGLYRFTGADLSWLDGKIIDRRHVIAINQRSYDESAFAVVLAVPGDAGWDGFTELGRALARLQQRGIDSGIGFMSAGYSSLTGHNLPSARRFTEIAAAAPPGALIYFALPDRCRNTAWPRPEWKRTPSI